MQLKPVPDSTVRQLSTQPDNSTPEFVMSITPQFLKARESEEIPMPVDQQATEYQARLAEYRTHITEARMKAQDNYDKTVLALSGAAIGVSLTIIKDFLGTAALKALPGLYIAWGCWALSMTTMLLSYYSSYQALHETLKQLDDGTIQTLSKRNQFYGWLTSFLNITGGLLFIVGVVSMGLFVFNNLR